MNEINYMMCTTCKQVVSQNPTGICLGCQSGFSYKTSKDSFLYHLKNLQKDIKEHTKGEEDAIKEGL